MKSRVFYTISIVSLFCETIFASINMVEQGKTWWYESGVAVEGNGFAHSKVTIGLRLGNSNSADEGLIPCYAIDSLKRNIIDIPIAHLRENEGKVWVTPNPELTRIDISDCSDELEILSTFLGFWRASTEIDVIEEIFQDNRTDAMWKLDSIPIEYLLYDFNYDIGDTYRWPWTQINYIYPDISENSSIYVKPEDRGFSISEVDNQEVEFSNEVTTKRKVFKLIQSHVDYTNSNHYKPCTIVEGIGITSGKPFSYFFDLESWYGFFVSPISATFPPLSGYYDLPFNPILKAVISDDGTHLYGDQSYQPSTSSISKICNEPQRIGISFIDLHGRPVSSPLRGSVYIRNGKKFVVK